MAKVKGIFQYSGTINGITYYMLNDEQVARKAGAGFNGNAIRTEASMEKVRQNASEFGAVSSFVKQFRERLAPMLFSASFSKLHSQLVKLFFGIKKLDAAAVGSRSIVSGLVSESGKKMLTGFSLPTHHKAYKYLHQEVLFDQTTGVFTFDCLTFIFEGLPKSVSAIGVQVGVLDLSSTESGVPAMDLSSQQFERATLGSTPMVLSVSKPLPDKGLAILSLCHFESRNGAFIPLITKDSFYLEVLSVWT